MLPAIMHGVAKLRLETGGRNPTQSGERAEGIVERLPIGKHIALRRRPGGILPQADQLTLEAAEEVFGNGVVVRIILAGHALTDTEVCKLQTVRQGGILGAALRVEDQAGQRAAVPHSHIQCGKGEICADAVRKRSQRSALCIDP